MLEMTTLGPFHGEAIPENWRPLIEKTGAWNTFRWLATWFAVEVDGVIAAVGGINLKWREDRAWMGPTYVDEAYRGKGIQSRLIKARLDYARSVSVGRVESAADTTNSTSLKNMLNAGFKVVRHNPEWDHLELLWSSA